MTASFLVVCGVFFLMTALGNFFLGFCGSYSVLYLLLLRFFACILFSSTFSSCKFGMGSNTFAFSCL